MNVLRSVSLHQHRCLRDIASGRVVVVFDTDHQCYVHRLNEELVNVIGRSKPRGRAALWGGHFQSSVIELLQRGLLVDVDGRLTLSKDAARQYGRPPLLPPPKRPVKMYRTRPARVL